MDKILQLTQEERRDLFSETAARKGMTPAIAEKDFWVTWTLWKIFSNSTLYPLLMFKGGTSLSKAFHVIERFSEDIDLILDWTAVTGENPLEERSNTSQTKFNENLNQSAQQFIADTLLKELQQSLGSICTCKVDSNDGHVVNIQYPASFSSEYLLPVIRLEIGPLAAWIPYAPQKISSYAAETFPHLFQEKECSIPVIDAERTFWEKVTILHQEAFRKAEQPVPLRYSRHYYDLMKLALSPVKQKALNDLELLQKVVKFKQKFYPRAWARYDLATPGSLKLLPPGYSMDTLKKDYVQMREMIYGDYPDFKEIFEVLSDLESEINYKA